MIGVLLFWKQLFYSYGKNIDYLYVHRSRERNMDKEDKELRKQIHTCNQALTITWEYLKIETSLSCPTRPVRKERKPGRGKRKEGRNLNCAGNQKMKRWFLNLTFLVHCSLMLSATTKLKSSILTQVWWNVSVTVIPAPWRLRQENRQKFKPTWDTLSWHCKFQTRIAWARTKHLVWEK